jgi:hypothetical protein
MRQRAWQSLLDWFRPDFCEASTRANVTPSTGPSTAGAIEASALAGKTDEMAEGELREFLAADFDPIAADPVFKEHLRERLWRLVEEGATARSKDH